MTRLATYAMNLATELRTPSHAYISENTFSGVGSGNKCFLIWVQHRHPP